MTVPAKDVKVGWRVNPGTPHEWTVVRSTEWNGPLRWMLHDGDTIYMRVPPEQEVPAAPPPRMITVPAMDDDLFAWMKSMPDSQTSHLGWDKWIAAALAAHEREAT